MNKTQLIDKIIETRSAWDVILAEMNITQLAQPVENGVGSVKDLLAHISWYEHEMVFMIQSRTLHGSDWWNLPLDVRNDLIFQENKDRTLVDIVDSSRLIHQQLLQLIESLSEDDLQLPSEFPGMPTDWLPWQVIASNTYEHYLEHPIAVIK